MDFDEQVVVRIYLIFVTLAVIASSNFVMTEATRNIASYFVALSCCYFLKCLYYIHKHLPTLGKYAIKT